MIYNGHLPMYPFIIIINPHILKELTPVHLTNGRPPLQRKPSWRRKRVSLRDRPPRGSEKGDGVLTDGEL